MLLEGNKDAIGLKFYNVGATALDQVFLNVVRENNVREEGFGMASSRFSPGWWCF